jgi:hypothetical protein
VNTNDRQQPPTIPRTYEFVVVVHRSRNSNDTTKTKKYKISFQVEQMKGIVRMRSFEKLTALTTPFSIPISEKDFQSVADDDDLLHANKKKEPSVTT